jgi:hypothetical protein
MNRGYESFRRSLKQGQVIRFAVTIRAAILFLATHATTKQRNKHATEEKKQGKGKGE